MRNAGVVKTFLVMTFRSGIDTARERRRRDRYVAGGVGASPSRGRGHNSRCLCGRVSGNPKNEQPRALPSTPPRRARACAVASKLSTTTTPLERVVRPVLRSVWLDAIAMRHGWVFRQSGRWAYLHEQGVRVLARLGKKFLNSQKITPTSQCHRRNTEPNPLLCSSFGAQHQPTVQTEQLPCAPERDDNARATQTCFWTESTDTYY
jgi:hypothetical protein